MSAISTGENVCEARKESPVTVAEMIKCVRRELALRKNVYPGFVARGRMKQAEADKELMMMQAVHDLLEIVRSAPDQRVTHQPDGTVKIQDPAEEASEQNAKALAGLATFRKAAKEHFGG